MTRIKLDAIESEFGTINVFKKKSTSTGASKSSPLDPQ